MYQVRSTVAGDIVELSHTMRQADIDECWATSHSSPKEALKAGVLMSEPNGYTWWVGNRVGCIFGVVPQYVIADIGVPWMLGSDLIDDRAHGLQFARTSIILRDWAQADYRLLRNNIDIRNERAVRWLKWMGFTVEKPRPFGPDDVLFSTFSRERTDV